MPHHDLIVIGGGPGGYVAAIRAAQLGLNVACVEKEPQLGGTCLRIGCIPSKALLESSEKFYEVQHSYAAHGIKTSGVELDLPAMLARKTKVVDTLTKGIEGLLKKNKITRYTGTGRFAGPGKILVDSPQPISSADTTEAKSTELTAPKIIIATGSKSATLPGIELDGNYVGTSSEALSYDRVPGRLIVIGGGYIGMELGSVWLRLGSKVTVLEYLDRILPGSDAEIASEAYGIFAKQGFDFRLKTKVLSARADGDGAIVQAEGTEPLRADRVLVAVGRVPYTEHLGLETIGLTVDKKGKIPVDRHYATSVPGVYAIGDVIDGPMLAHKAEEEGVAVAEYLVTGHSHVNYDVIPAVIFTDPEIASVGQTEEQLQAANIPYKKGKFPFRANGRAISLGLTTGWVKVLAHQATDRVLGVHIIGPRAGDLIAEAGAAMSFGASSEDIARTCHAHPTLPETLKEAAWATFAKAIHM
ncbi:MAG: dihydrolipoyl dehydrogenase [Pirellulales bacterium]|nr:dihydrolipoyl dehydrogenase [Pirellulales bacterium]